MNDTVAIGEVALVFLGVSPGRVSSAQKYPDAPLINIKDLDQGKILPTYQLETIKAAVSEHQRLLPGDLLVSIRGTLLKTAIVKESHRGALATGNIAIMRPNPNRIFPEILQAVLQSDSVRSRLMGTASGAVIKGLQLGILRDVQFALPPMHTQEELAHLVRISEAQYHVALLLAEERLGLARAVVASHLEAP